MQTGSRRAAALADALAAARGWVVKRALLAGLLFGVAAPAFAGEECLLVTELKVGRVAAKQGLCATRHSPASTFKIPLSLMGFDAGILKSPSDPVWSTEPGLAEWNETWIGPKTPESWMRQSVVWYSQLLTRRLGAEKLKDYVHRFVYGNENLSGNPGKDDGLTNAWLSSSLQISPREQVDFLRKMLKGDLPVSLTAVDQTITLLKLPERPAGWDLYGKTGSGYMPTSAGTLDRSRPFGWFVGWAEKDGQTFVFVRYLSQDFASNESLGFVARRQTITALEPILQAQDR